MDFAAVVEQINKLLGMVHPGATLPEGTTEENLVEYLNLAMSIITGGEAPELEAGAAEGGDVLTESLPPALAQGQDKMFALIQDAVKKAVEPQLKALANEVKELKTDKANAAKSAFEGRCKALLSNGVPAAALEQAKKIGATSGYDMAVLDLVESTSGKLRRSPVAKSLANTNASPLSSDETPRRTDEQIAESLKARGIDPDKHMPKSRVSANGQG